MVHVTYDGPVCVVELSDNERHNILTPSLIDKLIEIYSSEKNKNPVRIICLRSTVKNFCAGADLRWMKASAKLTEDENINDIKRLAVLLRTIRNFNGITVSVVNGQCIGGGVGLACASDLVIAHSDADFRFSEVRLGIVPAIIAPYIAGRIGVQNAKKYILTGEIIDANEALQIGLTDYSIPRDEKIDTYVSEVFKKLLRGGPSALSITKHVLNGFQSHLFSAEAELGLIKIIAKARISGEGQEGMTAFFEKRLPLWNQNL